MGTDIHIVTQVRQPDGSWRTVTPERVCTSCDGHGTYTSKHDGSKTRCPWCTDYSKTPCESDGNLRNNLNRSYDTFAILADVRNGRGFAGCYTGAGFNPITAPKGLPENIVLDGPGVDEDGYEDTSTRVAGVWLGDHSHSWLTLAEILAYDWDQGTSKSGVVDEKEFKSFLENGVPDGWCGDVSGRMVRHIPQDEMKARIDNNAPDDGSHYYTRVNWNVKYRDQAKEFCESFIPALKKLVPPLGSESDVRIVFGFDS